MMSQRGMRGGTNPRGGNRGGGGVGTFYVGGKRPDEFKGEGGGGEAEGDGETTVPEAENQQGRRIKSINLRDIQ
jgi:hypothetical protein